MKCFWLLVFVLQMQCACGGGPLQDQKHWRRPVPGWRQSSESLALENQGFGFEEADFEVHFSEKGKELFQNLEILCMSYIAPVVVKTPLNICYRKIKFLLFFLFYKGGMWRWWSMRTWW